MTATDKLVENHLAHFGIKGMKWGVRRKRGSDGRVGGDSSDSSSESSGTSSGSKGGKTKAKKVKVGDLSDAELREAVNRMNLEKQYKQLAAEKAAATQSVGSKATKFIIDSGVSIATSQGKRAANAYVGHLIDQQLKSKGINTGKKKKKKK